MNIKIFKDNEVDKELKDKIYSLESLCYKVSLEKIISDYSISHFTPTFRHIFAFEKDIIISYLRVVVKEVKWQDKQIKIGGIGSVCTNPDFRGKGIASKLVDQAMKILQQEEVDFALLQTDIQKATKLYGQFGFIPAHKVCIFRRSDSAPWSIPAKDVMMSPISNKDVMQQIIDSDESEQFYIGRGDW